MSSVINNRVMPNLIEIWREARNGNVKKIKMLYEAIYPAMMNLCMRYTRNYQDACDVFEEAFLKIISKMKIMEYTSEEHLLMTIRKIFINTAIDYLRENKKNSLVSISDIAEKYEYGSEDEDAVASDIAENFHYTPEEPPDDNQSELEHILMSIPAETIIHAIQELPPAYRVVFNMYVIDGMSHEEIARELGISEGTSKSNLHKARKKLKEILKQKIPALHKFKI